MDRAAHAVITAGVITVFHPLVYAKTLIQVRKGQARCSFRVKLTNRPDFSGTVSVSDTLSRNPERCLRDAKMSRFGFRSPGWDRVLSR